MKTRAGDNGGSAAELRSYVERIEKLEAERGDLGADLKAVYAEARREGFDVKVLRGIIKRRKADPEKLAEYEATVEAYERALGDLAGTALGNAAVDEFSAKRMSRDAR